jgi:hypothetical protein
MSVAGVLLIGLGSGLYLAADLGPGPRDGLMTGLHHRFGWSIRRARTDWADPYYVSDNLLMWWRRGTSLRSLWKRPRFIKPSRQLSAMISNHSIVPAAGLLRPARSTPEPP